MLKKSFYKTRNDGVSLYINYSDEGFLIKQMETGQLYQEAIDVENSNFTYEETDIVGSDEAETEDYLAALSELGVK